MTKRDDSEDVEDAVLDSYMEGDSAAPGALATAAEELLFLRKRYEFIKQDYKEKSLLKEEAKAKGDKQLIANLRTAFHENYTTRRYLVRRLRELGEKVLDPFIAG